jgi:hypothetical protein
MEEKITKELDYDQVESTFYLEEMRINTNNPSK